MYGYHYAKERPVVITIKVIPFIIFFLGSVLLLSGIAPILSFKVFYQPQGVVVVPVPDEVALDPQKTAVALEGSNLKDWVPASHATMSNLVNTYKLSIPKLRIKDAEVRIAGTDLGNHLIHWGDSAPPGKPGIGVIFGHSILPQFYNPKNYYSIFSLIPQLKKGDEIFVKYDGVEYRYEVESQRVTTPDDLSGLTQKYDDSYLTLVTCVPPGTFLERLWLTARLAPLAQKK